MNIKDYEDIVTQCFTCSLPPEVATEKNKIFKAENKMALVIYENGTDMKQLGKLYNEMRDDDNDATVLEIIPAYYCKYADENVAPIACKAYYLNLENKESTVIILGNVPGFEDIRDFSIQNHANKRRFKLPKLEQSSYDTIANAILSFL